jgi:hypothetical protein
MLSTRNDFKMKSIRRQVNVIVYMFVRAVIFWPSCHIFNLLPPCIQSLIIPGVR